MLDSETKRRIDTARDILVGKVPDPKSQVEQITIALIYKFMDDMDTQAEELGGKRKFFVGEYAAYGWAKLMAPSVSGEERIALYAEGMVKMTQNPGVPALFRSIFKNAFLPYRDPETLKSFLKTINEFEYDHSERLGDAFEYLLSVLGSQGQAGQFRTPRHIIDFIVAIVDPKKTETVLDPACGTAGFLISAYKHILRANSSEPSPSGRGQGEGASNGEAALHTSKIPAAKGDKLTPDERKKLADNFRGYDISPDMVRLSLVNMYLHGFTDPHVFEYDTLTSQDRWNEMADCVLANPPFMSPKGGIRPHNRFSVQSKRSEVLFVDYMAEHLTPGGRAGIIVPEGIIFQGQTAYKQLRKMLVDEYLVAVVSLPAGVFQPYSGVKTSILILDKSLAKQSGTIGFFKVENDGFNLGAQRRPIDKNDLPQVLTEVNEYLRRLRAKESVAAEDFKSTRGLIVVKEKIAANGDYNFSGERYREVAGALNGWPTVRVGDIFTTCTGGTPSRRNPEYFEGGTIPWVKSGELSQGVVRYTEEKITQAGLDNSSAKLLPPDTVLIALYGATAGEVGILGIEATTNQAVCALLPNERCIPHFAYLHLKSRYADLIRHATGGAQPNISNETVKQLEIPLPPLEVQKEIVAEIDGYQKVIDGARVVLDHYRPHIPIQPDWPMVELGELCDVRSGGTPKREVEAYWHGYIPWITTSLIDFNVIDRAEEFITEAGLENSSAWIVPKGTVVMAMFGQGVTRGRVAVLGIDAAMNQACAAFTIRDERITSDYLYHALEAEYEKLRELSDARGGNQSNLSGAVLKQYAIPLPPLEAQRSIVSEIEAERRLVEANRELVARMEQKIAATLARIWGDDSAGPAPAARSSTGDDSHTMQDPTILQPSVRESPATNATRNTADKNRKSRRQRPTKPAPAKVKPTK